MKEWRIRRKSQVVVEPVLPDDVVEKPLAGIFEQLDDKFKTVVAAVIRVGNGGISVVAAQKIGKHHHAVALVFIAGHGGDVGHILVVHDQYIVKTTEIIGGKLSRAAVEVITVVGSVASHPAVG